MNTQTTTYLFQLFQVSSSLGIMKFVYIFKAGEKNYKIGIAKDVRRRLTSLQTSNHERIRLVCCRLVDDAEAVEMELHDQFAQYRTQGGTEWFQLEPSQVLDALMVLNEKPQVELSEYDYYTQVVLSEIRFERTGVMKRLAEFSGELSKIVAHDAGLAKQKQPANTTSISSAAGSMVEYEQTALRIFERENRVSASLLQRKMSIGYSKAARIIDSLEGQGLVGKSRGNSSTGRQLLGR